MAPSATVISSSRDPGSRALRTHLCIIHTAKGITQFSSAGDKQHPAQDICTAAAGVRFALCYRGCCITPLSHEIVLTKPQILCFSDGGTPKAVYLPLWQVLVLPGALGGAFLMVFL